MSSLNYEEVKAQIAQLSVPDLKISILLYRPKSEMNIAHIFRLADAVCVQKVWLFQPIEHIKWHKIEKLSRKNSRHVEYEIIESRNDIPNIHKIALEWTDTSRSIYDCSITENEILIVVGNEQKGIHDDILSLCHEAIHIPMYGLHSSMNMAMATGIAVYTLLHSVQTP